MAISKKPSKKKTETTPQEENLIEQLIEKGGSAVKKAKPKPQPEPKPELKVMSVQLRLPEELINEIDQIRVSNFKKGVAYKLDAPSRHSWFVSAILEKLERDKGE